MFREGWVTINSVPTHIVTWGGWIEDDLDSDSVIVFITGNPGITDFYFYFLETLHNITGIPTWIIPHAGNEPVPGNVVLPSIDKNPDLYILSGQVEHKKQFIKRYVSEGKKIYLLGHSVGGKISVELMKDEKICSRLLQVHLLFPVLQHIADTFNGKIYKHFIQYIIPVIVFLAWVFTLLPMCARRNILSGFFFIRRDWRMCHKETCLDGILKLFTPEVAKAALILAKDELREIKDLDSEIYDTHYDKIFCYYAQKDDWAPVSQFHHLMKNHPKINGVIMDEKFSHAFVLTAPSDMAKEVTKNMSLSIKS